MGANEKLTLPALPLSWMDRLFARMAAMYGRHWSEMWAGLALDDVKQAWAEDMAGYSGDEIKAGLDACKGRKFPPTLTEFQALCRPEFDVDAALHAAIREMGNRRQHRPEHWPSNRHFWAAASIGNDLLLQPPRDLLHRWREAWQCAANRADDPIPQAEPARQALPAPGKTHISREEAAERCETLKLAVGKGKATPKQIEKWKSNLADPKCSPAVQQMSREILAGLGEIQPEREAAA